MTKILSDGLVHPRTLFPEKRDVTRETKSMEGTLQSFGFFLVLSMVPDITAGTGTEFQENARQQRLWGAVAIGRSAGESPFRRWVSFRALSENL